jgi:hypothetical protein
MRQVKGPVVAQMKRREDLEVKQQAAPSPPKTLEPVARGREEVKQQAAPPAPPKAPQPVAAELKPAAARPSAADRESEQIRRMQQEADEVSVA